ncbi:MAG: DUF2283 domain-containing protein [Nanoarchaeota archaeon]|nr:DUF2283 domain-containing protein [Nanoarchaeota archaeon]
MMDFKIDYDLESDDLFVYLEGKKSKGAVEAGNFVFDFDEAGSLVAIQIMEASKTLGILLTKIVELGNIREFRAEAMNYRNMASVRFTISDDKVSESANILVPRIIEGSPVLNLG